MGGLGVRSVCMLAPSAFLASAAATLLLEDAILESSMAGVKDTAVSIVTTSWCNLAKTIESPDVSRHIQREWDSAITTDVYNNLLTTCSSLVDQVRLQAVVTPNAGDWLHLSLPLAYAYQMKPFV